MTQQGVDVVNSGKNNTEYKNTKTKTPLDLKNVILKYIRRHVLNSPFSNIYDGL